MERERKILYFVFNPIWDGGGVKTTPPSKNPK